MEVFTQRWDYYTNKIYTMETLKKIIEKQDALIELLSAPQYYEIVEAVKRKRDELTSLRSQAEQEEKKSVPTKDQAELRDFVLSEQRKGNIVIATIEGLMTAPLKEIVEQPAIGLLYDLNRDAATILTFINDVKWINDYACMQVICELKDRIESLQKEPIIGTDCKKVLSPEDLKKFKMHPDYVPIRGAILYVFTLDQINELIFDHSQFSGEKVSDEAIKFKSTPVSRVTVQCEFCGRKFIRKMPHRCNGGYRKRHQKWINL